jgi:inosine/xanthosine triphosphatase
LRERILVRVGSRNTAKLEAVRRGLAPFFAHVDVLGVDAPSGVDPQPLGFAEIVAGARNRARGSHSGGAGELAAGIEDGLIALPEVPTGWLNLGCCVLFDGAREGLGFSAGFEYPPDCVAVATRSPRTPIGDAFDRRFAPRAGARDPGAGAGNIGRLSEGALTRAEYGAQAVICAWLRFMHADLYAGVPA